MKATVEIEERSLIDRSEYERIYQHLQGLGSVETSWRVMINFTAMDYARDTSVELRLNDGSLSKVVKKGAFGGTVHEETTVMNETLQQALKTMASEGYKQAKISLRIRHVVSANGFEYCLREILHYANPKQLAYPTLFEIEAEGATIDKESEIRKSIANLMASLQVAVVNRQDFQKWSEYNHTYVDGDFVYSVKSARELEIALHSAGFLS